VLAADVNEINPEESAFFYMNRAARKQFGTELERPKWYIHRQSRFKGWIQIGMGHHSHGCCQQISRDRHFELLYDGVFYFLRNNQSYIV